MLPACLWSLGLLVPIPAAVHDPVSAAAYAAVFADPHFGATNLVAAGVEAADALAGTDAVADAGTLAAATPLPASMPGTLLTGFAIYAASLGLMTAWETLLPGMHSRGLLEDHESEELTNEERAVELLTPITCSRAVPLPTIEELEDGCHFIG